MTDVRIGLLGGFRVEVGGAEVAEEAWRRRRPAALVKLLALAPRHRLHREQVMDALWPDLAPAAAAANLRKAVYHARRVAGDESASLVVSSGELLALPAEGLWVDVDAFRAAADRARRSGDADDYREAVGLYRGGLLPDDRYEEWAAGPRDELHGDVVALLDELAALLEARGDLAGAARAVGLLIEAEPLREEAHARLMRLHALAGRRDDALRRYEQLRQLLETELGTEPAPETQRLYEEVRTRQAAEPELTAELWERVGELRVGSGDAAGAVKAFGLALAAAGSPAASARLHRRVAAAWLVQHRPDEAEEHLRAAEAADAGPAERGRVVTLRANQAWERGELDAAERLAAEARRVAQEHGDPDDVAAADEALAIVSHLRGDWRRGLELEIERSGVADASLARVYDIHHCIGQYHLYGDGLADDVEEYARRTLELALATDAVRAQAFAWCLLGESLLLQARFDESAGCLERSCELHGSLGATSGALPWQRLAELAVCRGASGEADAHLRRAAGIATVSPMAHHLWGRIHATAAFARMEEGDAEAAARSVRAAAAAAARYGDCPSCSALLNPVAAEALAALGDRDGARAYAESATRLVGMLQSSAWQAMTESAAGSVAVADGEPAAAQDRFRAAAVLYERAGQPYWAERSAGRAAAV